MMCNCLYIYIYIYINFLYRRKSAAFMADAPETSSPCRLNCVYGLIQAGLQRSPAKDFEAEPPWQEDCPWLS